MNLDSVSAELRPRGAWEAADFGARLVRRDAAVVYRVWFMLTLPLLALAALCIVFTPLAGWAQIAYWWLEPVVDGSILYVISRRLFGEDVDARAAVRAAPGLARRNWIFLLSPYRLHFARSLAMPVTQLEGLSGKRRRTRAKLLNQKTYNHGTGVTAAYQHLMLSLFLGVVLLGFAFVPSAYQDTIGLAWINNFDAPDGRVAALFNLLVFYVAQSALQPWFVGAGFGLYINRRTILEAWDIEISFRRMLQRRATKAVAASALLMLVCTATPDIATAEGPELEPWWDESVVESAKRATFSDPAFRTTETIEEWRSTTGDNAAQEPDPKTLNGVEAFFRAVGRFVAFLVEFGLWVAAAILLAIVVLTSKRWLPYLRYEPRKRRRKKRIVLASGEITAESLPNDIPAAVLAYWHSGERRRALSLLYRGSVFAAVDQQGVRLPDSATEGACVAAIRAQSDTPQADFFAKVVAAWVWYAYGQREPAADTVTALCREWPSHYGATS